MSDGMGREFTYLSSHATNRYFIPNWGIILSPLYTSLPCSTIVSELLPRKYFASNKHCLPLVFKPSVSWQTAFNRARDQELGISKGSSISDTLLPICS